MKTRDHITHEITWHDAGREPQCQPNPTRLIPTASTCPRRGPPLEGSGVWHQTLGQVPNSFGPGIRRSIAINPSCMQLSHRP